MAGWLGGWVGHADISRTAGPIWLKFCRKVVMVNETKRNFFLFVKFFFMELWQKTFFATFLKNGTNDFSKNETKSA